MMFALFCPRLVLKIPSFSQIFQQGHRFVQRVKIRFADGVRLVLPQTSAENSVFQPDFSAGASLRLTDYNPLRGWCFSRSVPSMVMQKSVILPDFSAGASLRLTDYNPLRG